MGTLLLALIILATSLVLYIRANDRKIQRTPVEALKWCERWTDEQDPGENGPIDLIKKGYLFERTGRRYIVVGGAGFLGGWIVIHLLQRGESPEQIRILDVRPPTRQDIQSAIHSGVQFLQTDISQRASVQEAFDAPWPARLTGAELTVIHTAAVIRFYERLESHYPISHAVNVTGTQNVLEAALSAGASVFVNTSSSSVSIKPVRFLLWPWESEPANIVQVLDDEFDHAEWASRNTYWSNYGRSKHNANMLVASFNGRRGPTGRVLQTGSLRPGGTIYGPGDASYESYTQRQGRNIPAWIHHVVVSNCYVQNCSIGHLALERALLDRPKTVGGQSYLITDGGPATLLDDVLGAITNWTSQHQQGPVRFVSVSFTAMFLLAHIIELVHLGRQALPAPFNRLFPRLSPDLVQLQPSSLVISTIHTIVDDRRARKEIGYRTPWDSRQAIRETICPNNNALKMPISGASLGAAKVMDKVTGNVQ